MDNSPGEAAEEAVGSNHAQHMPHASYGQSGKVITPTIQDDTHSTDDIKGPDQPAAPQAEFAPSTSVPVPVSTTLDIPAVSAPPPPPAPASPAVSGVEIDLDHPLAVSEVYSTYGMEYILMFISLAAAAISFGSLLNAIVDLTTSKSASLVGSLLNPYAEAALIVSFPIFAFLFLRLEAKEETDPSLATDASRRRGMQITLIVSFIIGLGGLIGYIGSLFSSSLANQISSSLGGGGSGFVNFLHAFIDLVIAGAIFGYYWYKLHRKPNRS